MPYGALVSKVMSGKTQKSRSKNDDLKARSKVSHQQTASPGKTTSTGTSSTKGSIEILVVVRTLFRSPAASKSKTDNVKTEWKPRSPLDYSGHSFRSDLKTELQRARQKKQEENSQERSLPIDDRFQAAQQQQQQFGLLRSPKSGLSSAYGGCNHDNPSAWWGKNNSKSPLHALSSTSTEPSSPPADDVWRPRQLSRVAESCASIASMVDKTCSSTANRSLRNSRFMPREEETPSAQC